MITDVRASQMFLLLHQGNSVAKVARRLRMSEKTVRKYRDANELPSQVQRPAREYRTRRDPLADFWPEIEALLEADRRLKPYAILTWLKQKYNEPSSPPRVTDEIRRTLERRVLRWKLEHGVEQEVHFPQVHHAGDVFAFDFVNMNGLGITIAGKPFDHLLFHGVFTYSNWEYVHVCHAESFEALSQGLQDALHHAGGAPRRVRSDSLSAAINNLSSDKEFTSRYRGLLEHYGVAGHRINVRKPHENGDIESSHGHWKDSVDQSLRLRGNRDFSTREAYVGFLREHASTRNAMRESRFREESAALHPLPGTRLDTHATLQVDVKPDCILRVKGNLYSVSSQYIDLRLQVRVRQDELELWHGDACVERLPRQFGRGKEAIDFRHVIDSLRRKPGAFRNYKYVHHLYPTTRFRMACDQLTRSLAERSAIKEYLELLYMAKYEGLDRVDDALRIFLAEGRPIRAEAIAALVKAETIHASPTDVQVDAPDLSLFDSLLTHKDVNDEEACQRHEHFQLVSNDSSDVELSAYDRYGQIAGSTQVSAVAHLSRELLDAGGPSSAGALDAHTIPGRPRGQGMSVEKSESRPAADEGRESAAREDVGAIQLDETPVACDATIRDLAEGRLPGPPGQCLDLWETGIGEDNVALDPGRSTREAGTLGALLDLPDACPGTTARETRPATGTPHQEAGQVRGVDHRRPGLCRAESRRDGGAVHVVRRTLRTIERDVNVQSCLLAVGSDLQGSHDHGGGDRSTRASFRDHRAEQGAQLPPRRSQEKQGPINRIIRWFQGVGHRLNLGSSN